MIEKNLFDVLIVLLQLGIPIVGTIVGVWLGGWWQYRNKAIIEMRCLYKQANICLIRYLNFLILIWPSLRETNISQDVIKEYNDLSVAIIEVRSEVELLGDKRISESFNRSCDKLLECSKIYFTRFNDDNSDVLKLNQFEEYGGLSKKFTDEIFELKQYKEYLLLHDEFVERVKKQIG